MIFKRPKKRKKNPLIKKYGWRYFQNLKAEQSARNEEAQAYIKPQYAK